MRTEMTKREWEIRGLQEQIRQDREALNREWKSESPRLDVVLQLSGHIKHCEEKLKEV